MIVANNRNSSNNASRGYFCLEPRNILDLCVLFILSGQSVEKGIWKLVADSHGHPLGFLYEHRCVQLDAAIDTIVYSVP